MSPDSGTPEYQDRIIVGRVLTTHGVRGVLKVEPLTDDPARFSSLRAVYLGGQHRAVESVRLALPNVLLKLAAIGTVEDATVYRNEYIYIDPEHAVPLPKGAYYHYELVGLRVVTADGRELGMLTDVISLASNDVYRVEGGEHGEVLVPAVKQVVVDIDLGNGLMTVDPIPGLLPGDAEPAG